MRHPIGEKKGVVFREQALVEDQQELAAVRSEALNGMGEPRGEELDVALAYVADKNGSLGI